MQKLIAGLVLLGLGLLVVVATIVHYATRLDPDRTPSRPALEGDPDPDLPDGDSVVVRIGGGRELTDAPDGPAPTPSAPPRPNGELNSAEKQQVDARGYLTYTVQKGDTMYSLGARYLGSGTLATQIMRHNPEVDRAEDIRVGMQLRIPLWLKQHASVQPRAR